MRGKTLLALSALAAAGVVDAGIWHKGRYIPPISGGDGTQGAVLDSLLDALTERSKARGGANAPGIGPYYRATPSTPSTPYYTGPGGLFGVAGLERDVISSRIQPMGLADRLPALATNVVQPLFGYLSGFALGSGVEPSGVCDDPPTAGVMQTCMQVAQLGRFSRLTRTVEVNRLGAQLNRGEFMDLRFMNDPLGGEQGGITTPPGMPGSAPNPRMEVAMRMIELGFEFQNWMGHKLYTGNPANNSGGDGYREFPGLDILIGTGHVDAITNTACASLDSDIKNFAYGSRGGTGGTPLGLGTTSADIYTALSYQMRYLRYNAEHMNFGATSWVMVMRPSLFWELTASWPCTYMTYRCQTTAGNEAIVDAGDAIRMRDDMRNGNYIMIDGLRYDVVLDSNIHEDTNTSNSHVPSGAFSSDIYIIPLSVRGGVPVTYWEYFDFRTSLNILGDGPLGRTYFWTDDGKYMWHLRPPTNWCIQWLGKIEPRIILRTPQLAGRLQNVVYAPLQHERDAWPDNPYFAGGGVSTARAVDTRYAPWSPVNTNGA